MTCANAHHETCNCPQCLLDREGRDWGVLIIRWLIRAAVLVAFGTALGACLFANDITFPAGENDLLDTIELSEGDSLRGEGLGTVLNWRGPADKPAIVVSGESDVDLSSFTLRGHGGLHGIVLERPGEVSGWRYRLTNIRVSGFQGCGVQVIHCEQALLSQVSVWKCGVGFYFNKGDAGGLGINNRAVQCRASFCDLNWSVANQSACTFEECQGLDGGKANFILGGSCNHCALLHLDVERAGIGLLASGRGHQISVMATDLKVGIRGEALTNSVIAPSSYSNCEKQLVLDRGRKDNTIQDKQVKVERE